MLCLLKTSCTYRGKGNSSCLILSVLSILSAYTFILLNTPTPYLKNLISCLRILAYTLLTCSHFPSSVSSCFPLTSGYLGIHSPPFGGGARGRGFFFIIIMPTLPQSTYKTTTWKGGVTRQIFISPADGDLSARQFDVRISSAIIDDVQSDFSDFSGFTRYILPLEGEITLIKEGRRIALSHNALYEFEGDE